MKTKFGKYQNVNKTRILETYDGDKLISKKYDIQAGDYYLRNVKGKVNLPTFYTVIMLKTTEQTSSKMQEQRKKQGQAMS